MRQIIDQLEGLRRRTRLLLLTQRVSVLLAWTVGLILALIAFDYALRLPGTLRLILLVTGAAALIVGIWHYLLAAVRFAPSLTQIALRIERYLPDIAGRLASSVEFSMSGVDRENALAARSVHETESRLAGGSFREAINLARTARDVAILLAVLAIAATFAVTNPAAAQTGLARLFVPYGGTMWPARTGVASLMHEVVSAERVHPRGQALPLRAEVTRGPHDQRITARYRLKENDAFTDWQTVVLTRQGQTAVHERLIESSAELIEVSFHSADDQTDVERMLIVPPPAVDRATLRVTPPPYAAKWSAVYEAELGPGVDSRAVTDTPTLIGSDVELRLRLSKPLPVPDDPAVAERWLRETIGWDDESPLPEFHVDAALAAQWTLRWQLDGTRALSIELVDQYGLRNTESIAYRINAVEDQPPSVTITTPDSDRAVLRSAVVPLEAEARDDVAVADLALRADVRRGGPPDAEARRIWSKHESVNAPAGTLGVQFDLSEYSVEEGDVIIITATARDHFGQEGEAREPIVSSPRRLRVISELEFATQLRRELGNVRQQSIRIEAAQSELQDSITEDGPQPGSERAQAQLAERIAAQQESIDEIAEQMRLNRLDDAQLEQLLLQSRDMLDFAGRAANRAAQEISERRDQQRAERAAGIEPERDHGLAPSEPDEADRDIVDAQQEVRDELTDLIALLDRDEDTWVITRQLETLRDQQQSLAQQTEQLERRTLGQSRAEMSELDLSELDRIAQRQRELRDEARQLLEDLRRRAEAIQDIDAQSSSGMRTAADTGEQRELDRDMDAAADRIEQNQLRSARGGQQQASETLERMLRDIQDTQRARAQELLRQLASLIESIDRLITVQERELIALAQAMATEDYTGRDRAMIRLNQNTQAVAGEARAAGQETRRIARSLDRAADAQGAAVTALRAEPVRHDEALEAEERSLALLKEARELAEELQEETEEAELRRRREELINAYRELVESQIALREQTMELKGNEDLDRRQLIEARRLSNAQDAIRTDLSDLEASIEEIASSAVFSHVHRRLDDWSRRIIESLQDGIVTMNETDRQMQIAKAIGRLIEALEETLAPPDDFEQDGADGGGSAGEQPLIPPVAELRLLRGIQEEIYNQTKQLDDRRELDDVQRHDRLRDLGREQRDLRDIGRQLLETLQGGQGPSR